MNDAVDDVLLLRTKRLARPQLHRVPSEAQLNVCTHHIVIVFPEAVPGTSILEPRLMQRLGQKVRHAALSAVSAALRRFRENHIVVRDEHAGTAHLKAISGRPRMYAASAASALPLLARAPTRRHLRQLPRRDPQRRLPRTFTRLSVSNPIEPKNIFLQRRGFLIRAANTMRVLHVVMRVCVSSCTSDC